MPHPDPRASDNPPTESARAANVVSIGDKASVDQIAVGENITQIKGYSAAEVTLLLTRIQTEYRPKPFDGRSPYIGLESFQERDADRFFGRENLIADLSARVMNSAATNARAVFVAGPSGSGKSSLVRAGLLPALRKGADNEHWLYETLKPGREPLQELKRVVASFTKSLDAGDDLLARALTDPTRLHQWVEIALKDETARRAVIVLDQFEEIFTQLTTPEQEKERAAFLDLLTYAATVENGRTVVVFTLRSDFVTNCASYPELNALVSRQFLQVGAMTPDELVSAIARPALQVGLRLDPALIVQVVNDVRGEPGALPLMQFALQDLFEAEKGKGELTLDGYIARGGLHEALERHADAEFAKLDDTAQALARSVFSGLVEIGRGREDTKRTALFQDLVPAGADAAQVQALVRELADARLITTDQQGDKETVTLAHERLIMAWAWLQRLVNENREAIALQNEIAQDAGEWDKAGREASYLYRGARLATAQEQVANKKIALSELAQTFVDASIDAQKVILQEAEAARERERHAEIERQELKWQAATSQAELERVRAEKAEESASRQAELAQKATALAKSESQARQRLRYIVVGLATLLLIAIAFLARPYVLSLVARSPLVSVPAAPSTFRLGATKPLDELEAQAYWQAPIAAFGLDEHEVTNSQYDLCVSVGACSPPADMALFKDAAKRDDPVVEITLSQADNFCNWVGRRLPSESEWEWAAKGAEQREYPTGPEKPDRKKIDVGPPIAPDINDGRVSVKEVKQDVIGTFGLAGNVSEWTISYGISYNDSAYRTNVWSAERSNQADVLVVVRGGSWASGILSARSVNRNPSMPNDHQPFIGFRCVSN